MNIKHISYYVRYIYNKIYKLIVRLDFKLYYIASQKKREYQNI